MENDRTMLHLEGVNRLVMLAGSIAGDERSVTLLGLF